MKKLMFILSLLLIISTSAFSNPLPNIEQITKLGFQVRMGELTGAGSRVPMANLRGLILPEGVIMTSDCSGIVIKKDTIDPKISDIIKIQAQGVEIPASEFVGFVVK